MRALFGLNVVVVGCVAGRNRNDADENQRNVEKISTGRLLPFCQLVSVLTSFSKGAWLQ